MKKIHQDASLSEPALAFNTANSTDFSQHFAEILAQVNESEHPKKMSLSACWIETILGPMIALADEQALYLLEFASGRGLKQELERLAQRFTLVPGMTAPLLAIQGELKDYFAGKLKTFTTAYQLLGSPFQQEVWKALSQIPYGKTISYAQESALLGRPKAYRAVGNANGANQLSIIVPCHRVIASDGSLGGYGGGLKIKRWLINHEEQFKAK